MEISRKPIVWMSKIRQHKKKFWIPTVVLLSAELTCKPDSSEGQCTISIVFCFNDWFVLVWFEIFLIYRSRKKGTEGKFLKLRRRNVPWSILFTTELTWNFSNQARAHFFKDNYQNSISSFRRSRTFDQLNWISLKFMI